MSAFGGKERPRPGGGNYFGPHSHRAPTRLDRPVRRSWPNVLFCCWPLSAKDAFLERLIHGSFQIGYKYTEQETRPRVKAALGRRLAVLYMLKAGRSISSYDDVGSSEA